MGVSEDDVEAVTIDIIDELYKRGLDVLAEIIVAETDAQTIASCFQVCSSWEEHLRNGKIWRRIIERKFSEDLNFNLLSRLIGWISILPSQGGIETSEDEYKQMVYKTTNYEAICSKTNLNSSTIYTGGLFSCLKLHKQWLFAGMLDGLIKMWDVTLSKFVKKPMRIFEGHEERVTSLDASENVLVSCSLDHSVRVWNIETTNMMRVLRGSGSPVILVRLLSDRLVWWSRSGTFQIWSWNGPENIEPKLKFKLDEDPLTCVITVGEHYIAVAPNDVYLNNEREVVIYNSNTGQRMIEKDIYSSAQIQCMDLLKHLLVVGAGCSVEVWDVEKSQCLVILGSNFQPSASLFVRHLCVSDYQVVAMLSNGNILHWQLRQLIKINKKDPLNPLHYDLQNFADVIENKEPAWKNLVLSDSRIVFGLEKKFGDVKIFHWSNNRAENNEEEVKENGFVRYKSFPRYTCRQECPECRNVPSEFMEFDLK